MDSTSVDILLLSSVSLLLARVIVLDKVKLVFAGSQDRFVEIEIESKLLEDVVVCTLSAPHSHNNEGQGKLSSLDMICEQDCSIIIFQRSVIHRL